MHLLSVSDVAERRVVIGVSCTRHDVVRRRLRLAEHGEIRVPHAVKVEIMDAEFTDSLALIAHCAGFDVLAVLLRADDINAWPGGGIAFFQRDNLLDVASLVIFCGDDVIIEIILSVVEFVFRLLTFPSLEERKDDLCIERECSAAAVGLQVADVVQAVLAPHGEALDLLRDGECHALQIAVIPRETDRLADPRTEVQPDDERHVECRAERVALKNHSEFVVLDTAPRLSLAERGEFFARHLDKPGRVFAQQLHRVYCIVESRGDVAEDSADRFIGISVFALLLNKVVDDGRRERRETVFAECRLDVQSDVLLAQLQCVVSRGKARAFVPDIQVVCKADAGIVFLCAGANVCVVCFDACEPCVLLCGISAALAATTLAGDLCFFEIVRPRGAALLYANVIEGIVRFFCHNKSLP